MPLAQAVKQFQSELLTPQISSDPVSNAKKVGLLVLGVAYQRFLNELGHQQEILANLTDVLMYAYAIESTHLRNARVEMTAVFTDSAMTLIEDEARTILMASSDGDSLRTNLAVLRRLTKREGINTIESRRRIARRLLEAERYVLA